MAAVSMRYAEALLASANDKDKIADNLKVISDLYNTNLEFKETFNNPRISKNEKVEILQEIIPNNEIIIRFVNLLLEEERFNLISDIYNKYQAMVDKLNKKINIKIVSSVELNDDEISGLVSKYKKLYGANALAYELVIDKSLIGGVKVIVLDKIYDGTIKTKLDEML